MYWASGGLAEVGYISHRGFRWGWTLVHVIRNIYENIPDDESREMYRVPKLVEDMLARGWLGEKTGRGFYQRVKKGGESENVYALIGT